MRRLKNKKYNFVVIFKSLDICNDEYILRCKSGITDRILEYRYGSLEEFEEEWEEDSSKSAMICGKEHIEIFKAWAKYTGDTAFLYDKEKDCLIANFSDEEQYRMYFSFTEMNATKKLINNAVYSLSELLGEYED